MNKKNITNDIIIDNIIYFFVKNMKSILYALWLIISLFVGFFSSYFIANNEDNFAEVFFFAGICISTIFALLISIIDGTSSYAYSNIISKHIQNKYNNI